jgi:hypothetical protein
MGRPKPKAGTKALNKRAPRTRKVREPKWEGIDPAVRAAYEMRVADYQAQLADPVFQLELAAITAAAQSAEPPFMKDGVELVPPIPDQPDPWAPLTPEERFAIRKRIANSQFATPYIQISNGKAKRDEDPRSMALTKLKAARKKAMDLGAAVRSDAFDDWYSRCVVGVTEAKQWTQADLLYQSYVRHVQKSYGWNRTDKQVAKEEMATETAWGKMMAGLCVKKRRAKGQYYPLRIKQGA